MHAPLGIAFWNTRLVPTSTSVAVPERVGMAARLLEAVIASGDVGFLGLSEIGTAVLSEVKQQIGGLGSYQDCAFDNEDVRWRLGFIYNPEVFELVECERVFASWGTREARAALQIRLNIRAAEQPITIFLVHWLSQREPDSSEIRKLCGQQLWSIIRKILRRDPKAWVALPR